MYYFEVCHTMRLGLTLTVYNGCEELKNNFMSIYKEAAKLGDS